MNATLCYSFVAGIMLLAGGCASDGANLPPLTSSASLDDSYVLGAGDKLQIALYDANLGTDRPAVGNGGEQFTVSESGSVDAPMIGAVPAAGLTVDQLKQQITAKLAQGYLKHPKVGIELVTYRPFYIVGEVNHPGAYPCTARSRVLSAVAIAGGYTYRANEDFAVVERKQGDKIVSGRVGPDTAILPDDVIRISQRYF